MHYCKFLHMRIARARGEFFEWFCKRISKVILSFTFGIIYATLHFRAKMTWYDNLIPPFTVYKNYQKLSH